MKYLRSLAASSKQDICNHYPRCWDCLKCIQIFREWIGEILKCRNFPRKFVLYERGLSGNLLAQKQTHNQLLSIHDFHPELYWNGHFMRVFFDKPKTMYHEHNRKCSNYISYTNLNDI